MDGWLPSLVIILVLTPRTGGQEWLWNLRLTGGNSPFDGRADVFIDTAYQPICDEYITPHVAMVICRELGFSPQNVTMTNRSYQENVDSFFRCDGNENSLMNDCGWVVYPLGKQCQSHEGLTCNGNIQLAHGSNSSEGNVQIYREGQWAGICDYNASADTAKVICRQMGYESDSATLYTGSYYGAGLAGTHYIECRGNETSHEECLYRPVPDPALCGEQNNLAVNCRETDVYTTLFSESYGDDSSVQRALVYSDGFEGYWCDDVSGAGEGDLQKIKNIASVLCANARFSRHNPKVFEMPWSGPHHRIPMLSTFTMLCTGQESDLSGCVRRSRWMDPEFQCNNSTEVGIRCNVFIRLANGTSNSNGRIETRLSTDGTWKRIQLLYLHPGVAKVVCRHLGYEAGNYALRHGDYYGHSEHDVLPVIYTCSGDEEYLQDCQQDDATGQSGLFDNIGVDCDAAPIQIAEIKTFLPEKILKVNYGSGWLHTCVNADYEIDAKTTGVLCHSLGYSRFRSNFTLALNRMIFGATASDVLMRVECKGTEKNITECSLSPKRSPQENELCSLTVVLQCKEIGTCPTPTIEPKNQMINCFSGVCGKSCNPTIETTQCSLENGGGCASDWVFQKFKTVLDLRHTFSGCLPHCISEFSDAPKNKVSRECCYGNLCNNPNKKVLRLTHVIKLHGLEGSQGVVTIKMGAQWSLIDLDGRTVPHDFLEHICLEAGYNLANIVQMKDYKSYGESAVRITDYNKCTKFEINSCPYSDRISNGSVLAVNCNARNPMLRLVDGGSPNMGRLEVFYNKTWGTVCSDGFTHGSADLICRSLGFRSGCNVYSPQAGYMAYFRYGTRNITFSKLNCNGDEKNIWYCDYELFKPGQSLCTHSHDVGIVCEEAVPVHDQSNSEEDTADRIDTTPLTPAITQTSSLGLISVRCAEGTCSDLSCVTSSRVSAVNCNIATGAACFMEQRRPRFGDIYFKFGCRSSNCQSGTKSDKNMEDVTVICCSSPMCNIDIQSDNILDVIDTSLNATGVVSAAQAAKETMLLVILALSYQLY